VRDGRSLVTCHSHHPWTCRPPAAGRAPPVPPVVPAAPCPARRAAARADRSCAAVPPVSADPSKVEVDVIVLVTVTTRQARRDRRIRGSESYCGCPTRRTGSEVESTPIGRRTVVDQV